MIIDSDKISAVVHYGPYCWDNPLDPVRKTLEEKFGSIIKVVPSYDGYYITIFEIK